MTSCADDVVYGHNTLSTLVADDSLELEQEVRIEILGKLILLGDNLIELFLLLLDLLVHGLLGLTDFLFLVLHDSFLGKELLLLLLKVVLLCDKSLSELLLVFLSCLYLFLKSLELPGLGDGLHHLLAGLTLVSGLVQLDAQGLELLFDFLDLLVQFKVCDLSLVEGVLLVGKLLGDFPDLVLNFEHLSQNNLQLA